MMLVNLNLSSDLSICKKKRLSAAPELEPSVDIGQKPDSLRRQVISSNGINYIE